MSPGQRRDRVVHEVGLHLVPLRAEVGDRLLVPERDLAEIDVAGAQPDVAAGRGPGGHQVGVAASGARLDRLGVGEAGQAARATRVLP
jgi:hypothetical protein